MKIIRILFAVLSVSVAAMAQNKVAILDFKNNGPASQQHLSEGIANMLATTLAGSSAIEVVERSALDKIVQEMKLGMTGLVDPKSAAQVGKVAGANLVVIGSYTALGKSIRLDAKVVNVETSVIVKGAAASAKASNMDNLDDAVDALAQKLLKNLTGEQVKAAVQGDPNKPGRLEFAFTGKQMIALLVDGQNIQATDDLKAAVELAHGRHKVQIERITGMFKSTTELDTLIEIPGGYIVRAEYKNKKLNIFEIVPIPSAAGSTAATATTAKTTTTTGMKVSADLGQGMGSMKMEISDETPDEAGRASASAPEPSTALSKVMVMSAEGMCDIYLDGVKKLSLPMTDIDGMASGTIFDVRPGTYHLKIEGFGVWYEGALKVNPGEDIKIKAEPRKFEIIGRSKI